MVERYELWGSPDTCIRDAADGDYMLYSDHAATEDRCAELEAENAALLRRVDELETRVALADGLAQRVAGAPVARVERWAGGTWVLQKCDATGIYAPVSGKRVALVLLEDHESGGQGS